MRRVFYCPKTDRYQDYVLRHGRDWEKPRVRPIRVSGVERDAREGANPRERARTLQRARFHTSANLSRQQPLFQSILKL